MTKRINLIPMAGLGQRFVNEGYTTPKPLLLVDGLPMIVQALKALPKAEENVVIIRTDQVDKESISNILNKHFDHITIIEIDKLTEGQASTCLLAEKYIHPNAVLTIGACDNGMEYNKNEFELALQQNDALIWTFRNNPSVLLNPNMYGWVKLDVENKFNLVSCKKQISDNPIMDHAIIGAFTFKKAKYFFNSVKKMIALNDRVNNEFYVDNVFNHLEGEINVFEVKKYICWGTPSDYEKYTNQ